jgi:hypothetical protein
MTDMTNVTDVRPAGYRITATGSFGMGTSAPAMGRGVVDRPAPDLSGRIDNEERPRGFFLQGAGRGPDIWGSCGERRAEPGR